MVLKASSPAQARKFLKENRMLAEVGEGRVGISPETIGGLDIRLAE